MHKGTASVVLGIATIFTTLPIFAAKIEGTTMLKDSQPYGTKDKEHKHQGYDLIFEANSKSYTCRTDTNKSMNATDFVVGTQVHYEVNGNKAKIKTPEKKEVECKIVRVEATSTAP